MEKELSKDTNSIEYVNEKPRIQKWDNLKFFLIFLVVLGHILEGYLNVDTESLMIKRMRFFIYTFHMPLFIFLSGLFSKKNINNKRYSNMFYYLVIFYLIKGIMFVSNALMNRELSFSLLSEDGIAWYALALCIFGIITIPLSKLNKNFVFLCSLALACVVGYDAKVGDYLCLSRLIVFYPFFFLGYCLDLKKVNDFISKKVVKVLAVICILLFAIFVYIKIEDIYWVSPILSGRNSFSTLEEYRKFGVFLRIANYIIATIMGASVMALIPSFKKIKIFSNFGRRTLQTYVLHEPIVMIFFFGVVNPNIYLPKILPIHSRILIIPIALTITMFCSLKIWEKPFDILKKYCMPKKEEI